MNTWFRRTPVRRSTDGRALLLWPPGATSPLALSSTAHAIWNALDYPRTGVDVAAAVAAECQLPASEVAADVSAFLDDLHTRGLATRTTVAPTPERLARDRYLGVLKRALAGVLHAEQELRIRALLGGSVPAGTALDRARWLRDIQSNAADVFRTFMLYRSLGSIEAANLGFMPQTLIGLSGLDNVEHCAEAVFADGIPGDFLEAGVALGGAAVFLRALQAAHGERHRRLWVADSFQGLPAADASPDVSFGLDLTEPAAPLLVASAAAVRELFTRYDLLDDDVRFLAGWFSDTLRAAPVESLAILRIDADMYRSTLDVLEALYDRVSPGGFVIVDDYGFFAPCRQAVDEFRASRSVRAPIQWVDADRIYWRKDGR